VAVERVDFERLFRASGLDQPLGLVRSGGGEAATGALGSVALQASARGRLADAGSFTVSQDLDFTAPRRSLPAVERLRGDFVHVVRLRDGSARTINVTPRSPDFVALQEVPPLFVRTLLIGEDADFFGHQGIDLRALPEAVLTNWKRGGAIRGASTITQQLAKNLFLSTDKRLGRKVQELCLALLLESTLGKSRILEIYLNVIEWGPDLFGLGPAARHYFGRDPRELTPKQMAFLVALVPGPIKYQRSFADGTPSPGFLRLVENLLIKLRSVDALSQDAYQAALAEPLGVGPAAAAVNEVHQDVSADPGP
jgi:membrane peptidoglycan carboxypeptidase